jgi:hypothetical protein
VKGILLHFVAAKGKRENPMKPLVLLIPLCFKRFREMCQTEFKSLRPDYLNGIEVLDKHR